MRVEVPCVSIRNHSPPEKKRCSQPLAANHLLSHPLPTLAVSFQSSTHCHGNYQLSFAICEAVLLVSDDANQPVVERGRPVILTRHILNDNLPLRLTYTHSSSRNENTPARPDESKWVLRRVVPWRFAITVGNLTLLEVNVAGRTCGIRFTDRRFAALS